MKIHHIGYLVHDKEAAMQAFHSLGYSESAWMHDSLRKIDVAFVENGGVLVELVHPDKDCEIIGKTLKKLRNAPYHICYECTGMDEKIIKMQEDGWKLIQAPTPAAAIGGRRVAFLFGSDVGLIELAEKE